MIDFPTPITQMVPPRRTANAAVHTLLSTPVHSRTVRGAKYSSRTSPSALFNGCSSLVRNSCRILCPFSSALREGSTWYVRHEGTNSLANCSLLGSMSVMTIGWAPDALAAASAMRPMGPAPHMTVPQPRARPAVRMPWRTTLSGSRRAPSAKEMLFGSLRHSVSALECMCSKYSMMRPTCEATWLDESCIAESCLRVDRRRRT